MHRPAVSYRFDDVILNPETFSVEKSGRVLALEPKSIRLLLYLIQNRSRTVGKEELLSNVWEDVAVSDNALARVVAQLRKALSDDAKVAHDEGPIRERLRQPCVFQNQSGFLPAGFNMTPLSLSPSAVGRDGRIILPINVPEIFFYQAAVFDPARGAMTVIPAPLRVVVTGAGWTPDGNIVAVIDHWSSSLWRYRISLQNKGRY